jgi:ribosomal protein L29
MTEQELKEEIDDVRSELNDCRKQVSSAIHDIELELKLIRKDISTFTVNNLNHMKVDFNTVYKTIDAINDRIRENYKDNERAHSEIQERMKSDIKDIMSGHIKIVGTAIVICAGLFAYIYDDIRTDIKSVKNSTDRNYQIHSKQMQEIITVLKEHSR